MNWEKVERRLKRGFSARPRLYGSTLLIERRQPFPLARVIDDALSEDEADEFGPLESWPGSVAEVLEQNGVDEDRLLGFYWDGFGPISWVAGVSLIGKGQRRYLGYWDEDRVVPRRGSDRPME